MTSAYPLKDLVTEVTTMSAHSSYVDVGPASNGIVNA